MQIEFVPLSTLEVAPENVRKMKPSTIDDLAASIKAQGLKHNLVGYRVGKKVFVSAGGRRLAAMMRLHKDGQLPEDLATAGVPVMLGDATSAHEASLAENTVREAMHPADEFQAFSDLKERYKLTNAEIATRFGCPEKHVEQRMRLARVAPSILAEYREGKLNLDQVMALAVLDDPGQQQKVWKATRSHYDRQPEQLRDAMLAKEVDATSGLGKFVTVEDYKAAGGTPREDLFSETISLPDVKLVNRLAQEKLQVEADKLKAAGWGWVEVRPKFDWRDQQKFHQRFGAKPNKDLGAVVTLNEYSGQIETHTGLAKAGSKAAKQRSSGVAVPAKVKCRESTNQLLGVRTGIIRNHLRARPALAIQTLVAAAAESYFSMQLRRRSIWQTASALIEGAGLGCFTFPQVANGIKLVDAEHGKREAKWEKQVVEGAKKHGSVLGWLLRSPDSVAYDLLAFMATESVDATEDTPEANKRLHQFCAVVDVNVLNEWSVTQEWLAKQPKEYLLSISVEAGGKGTDKAMAKLRGKDLVERVFQLLQEKQWQPPQLRSPATPKPAKKAAKKKAKKGAAKAAKKQVEKQVKKALKLPKAPL